MEDTGRMQQERQLELLLESNQELIDALQNLRKRLGGESVDLPDERSVDVEAKSADKWEE